MNLHNPSFECAGCGRMVGPPNVWIDDGATWCSECVALGARARRWMRLEYHFLRVLAIGLVLGVLLLAAAQCANGQVTMDTPLVNDRATVMIRNSTLDSMQVEMEGLYWTTEREVRVDAIVGPSRFKLAPGQVQHVRIMVREPVEHGQVLRLSTLLTPVVPIPEGVDSTVVTHIVMATRWVTKVTVR